MAINSRFNRDGEGKQEFPFFRSFQSRMFAVFGAVLFVAMAAISLLYVKLTIEQMTDATLASMRSIAYEMADMWNLQRSGEVSLHALSVRQRSLVKENDAIIWLVNSNGFALAVSSGQDTEAMQLSQEEMERYLAEVLQGEEIVRQSTFEERFAEPVYTIGVPAGGGRAVFIHKRISQIRGAVTSIAYWLGLAAIGVFAVGSVLIAIMARQISKPLLRMANVARTAASGGKFDQRIEEEGCDEVRELARAFNSMSDDLKNLESVRRDFVANVSHELRSPLTSIQGYVQGVLDHTISQEDIPKYLDIVLSETQRLNRLISELLDLSRLESGKFPLNQTAFDINELLRRVLVRFEGRIEERNMSVEVVFRQETCMVNADAARMEQVFTNLIDNAVKYGKEGGTLTIWTHASPENTLITIKDDGPGIQEADLPFVFERFYKADKAHSGLGTGLGLSIVKRIIEQHNGTIDLQSRQGEGTIFLITLKKEGQSFTNDS